MCGIVCAFNLKDTSDSIRPNILKMVKKVRHRGPDWSGIYSSKNAVMAHERLAIVDPTSGKQPILSDDNTKAIAVNGEIYNHLELRDNFAKDYKFRTDSDCEIILALYKKYGFLMNFKQIKKYLNSTPEVFALNSKIIRNDGLIHSLSKD